MIEVIVFIVGFAIGLCIGWYIGRFSNARLRRHRARKHRSDVGNEDDVK